METQWWTQTQNLTELLAAKKEVFQAEKAERKKELESLKNDGIITEADLQKSLTRTHLQGLKFEMENFLADTNITQETFNKILNNEKTVNLDFADYVSGTTGAPKEFVYNLLPLENKEEVIKSLQPAPKPEGKKRGRPPGSKNKNGTETVLETLSKVAQAKLEKNKELTQELADGFRSIAETLDKLVAIE